MPASVARSVLRFLVLLHLRTRGSTFRLALLSSPFSLATSPSNLKWTVPATCNADRDLRHKISVLNQCTTVDVELVREGSSTASTIAF